MCNRSNWNFRLTENVWVSMHSASDYTRLCREAQQTSQGFMKYWFLQVPLPGCMGRIGCCVGIVFSLRFLGSG